MIRTAGLQDLEALQTIEGLACQAFREIGMDSVADDEPPDLEDLRAYAAAARAWVAVDALDSPIAYILVDELDGAAHIAQVTVHPRYARQGVGKALIGEVDRWAAARRLGTVTLTTFRDVPWNAPYYARLGFTEVAEPSWSQELHRIVEKEESQGLGAWPRIVMKRDILAAE